MDGIETVDFIFARLSTSLPHIFASHSVSKLDFRVTFRGLQEPFFDSVDENLLQCRIPQGATRKVKERGKLRNEESESVKKGALMEIAIQSETDFVVGLCCKSREEGKW